MATLDRKTKRLLDKLVAAGNPSKKSSKNAELSSETLSVLAELEAPSKKVNKKHKKTDRKNKITSVTRKAIAHVTSRRPTKSTGSRGKVRPLEEKTKMALLKLQAQGATRAPLSHKHVPNVITETSRKILMGLVPSDESSPSEIAYGAVISGAESPSKIFDKHSLMLSDIWNFLVKKETAPELPGETEDDRQVRLDKGIDKASDKHEEFRIHLLLYPTDEILSVLEYDPDGHNSGLLLEMILKSSSQIDGQLFSGVLDLCVSKLHQEQTKLNKDDLKPYTANSPVRDDYLSVSFLAYIINDLFERYEVSELTGFIEPHLHVLDEDDKEYLSREVKKYLQLDYNSPEAQLDPQPTLQTYLDLIRKIRFKKGHLEDLAGNSFGLMNAYETNWKDYITNFGTAAIAGATGGVAALLLLSTGIGAVLTAGGIFFVFYHSEKIRTMGEYKRHKMICETLWRSATERGFILERDYFKMYGLHEIGDNELYGWRVDPRSIREKCLRYNKELKKHALEVEKLRTWWQTSCQRTLNNEEDMGGELRLPGPDDNLLDDAWNAMRTMVDGMLAETPEKAEQSILKRIDKVTIDMGTAVAELIKLEVDLEVAKHYWNLDDVHADVDLANKLVSDCAMYKNILDYFDELSDKKFVSSKKRYARNVKTKRQESNEIARRISALTTAVNNNTKQVSESLKQNQVDIRDQFSKAESAFKNNRDKIAVARQEAATAKTEAATAREAAEAAAEAAKKAKKDVRRAGGKAPGTFGAMGDQVDGVFGS